MRGLLSHQNVHLVTYYANPMANKKYQSLGLTRGFSLGWMAADNRGDLCVSNLALSPDPWVGLAYCSSHPLPNPSDSSRTAEERIGWLLPPKGRRRKKEDGQTALRRGKFLASTAPHLGELRYFGFNRWLQRSLQSETSVQPVDFSK